MPHDSACISMRRHTRVFEPTNRAPAPRCRSSVESAGSAASRLSCGAITRCVRNTSAGCVATVAHVAAAAPAAAAAACGRRRPRAGGWAAAFGSFCTALAVASIIAAALAAAAASFSFFFFRCERQASVVHSASSDITPSDVSQDSVRVIFAVSSRFASCDALCAAMEASRWRCHDACVVSHQPMGGAGGRGGKGGSGGSGCSRRQPYTSSELSSSAFLKTCANSLKSRWVS
mmetsp:Transcript_5055/g.16193  ORF Transcript_5055/g.16193 Transcript_5055/m.16193 type:complete len:232 (+) Transcript_5055:165-860(+)